MKLRTALVVLLAALMATSAWAQARTAPAGDGPKPAMIVDGRALTPAAWVEGLQGETVTVNGVSMMWVGAAAKAAGGTATIVTGPEGKLLQIRSGIRSMEFLILPHGEFWRHPWVRKLIADVSVYRLQPMPYWPYEEANIPARPPHGVNWKRPYLDWKPDEAWLLINLTPPPPPEPEPVVVPERDTEVAEPAAPVTRPTPEDAPPDGMGGMPPGGGMGGPPPDDMMMDEPPPM
ncbi:MAG: hypothetical protein ACOX9R_00685 [Armatimonadota bacterium]|jgi:hypothetical protein